MVSTFTSAVVIKVNETVVLRLSLRNAPLDLGVGGLVFGLVGR
jgi:hypothetical protein